MCSRIGRAVDIEDAAYFDRFNLVAELAARPVANRGRLMTRETEEHAGWALPRSCP